MTADPYLTAFDVAAEPFRWGGAGEGLGAFALLVLGAVLVAALRRNRLAGALAAGAAALLAAGLLLLRAEGHWRDHAACTAALLAGEGRVLEGPVQDLHPLRSVWQRPSEETFTVAGERLRVPLLAEGCGYHRTTLEGGPFREGLRVRLRLWRGQLLRVELEPPG